MKEKSNMICLELERREKLREHSTLNGIDYIEVPKDDQQNIRVYFIKPDGIPELTTDQVRIEGGVRIRNVLVKKLDLTKKDANSIHYLEVNVDKAGDFSTYTLVINSPGNVDIAFSKYSFSFKAGCPSDFDCQRRIVCSTEQREEPVIDYMAKDYASFRQSLIDLIPTLTQDWKQHHEADLGIALIELFAYMGDQLSYYQDAVANEAYLETARQRESVKRHARLIDYNMHEGASARTFIHFYLNRNGSKEVLVTIPKGTQVISRIGVPLGIPDYRKAIPYSDKDKAISSAKVIFETIEDATIYSSLSEINIHTWGNKLCCVPKGAVSLYLEGDLPLYKGDLLLLEEVKGPETGLPTDADLNHRQVVRLLDVKKTKDDLQEDKNTGEPLKITQVIWSSLDALTFPLSVSSQRDDGIISEEVSVARGNLVLADHGQTIIEWHPEYPYMNRVEEEQNLDDLSLNPKASGIKVGKISYRFGLKSGPVTFHAPLGDNNQTDFPVHQMMKLEPQKTVANVQLKCYEVAQAVIQRESTWKTLSHLLDSNPFDRNFVVETRNDGKAVIRFGDEKFGLKPAEGSFFEVTYRVGNGISGNVGPDTLCNVIMPKSSNNIEPSQENNVWSYIKEVRNPLPAWGGTEPETIDQVRLLAPKAFHAKQYRAVTEDDYARKAEEQSEVDKAVANFRWTGSWHTAFIRVDPKGRVDFTPDLEELIHSHISRYKLAGYDIEIEPPVYVPLEIEINICVGREHFRANVKEAVLEALSNQEFRDGHKGFFHPDNFTFGERVYLSHVYQTLEKVEGVDSAEVILFKRLGKVEGNELNNGFIPMGGMEIACLDNDPNFPENGLLRLNIMGGK